MKGLLFLFLGIYPVFSLSLSYYKVSDFWGIKNNIDSLRIFVYPQVFYVNGNNLILWKIWREDDKSRVLILRDGKKIFEYNTQKKVYKGASIGKWGKDIVVAVGDYGGKIVIFSLKNKRKLVELKRNYRIREIHFHDFDSDGIDELIIVMSDFNIIEIYNLKTQKTIFYHKNKISSFIVSFVSARLSFKDSLFIFNDKNKIFCYNIKRNKIVWMKDLGLSPFHFLLLPFPRIVTKLEIVDTLLIAGTFTGDIYLINSMTGKIYERINVGKSMIVSGLSNLYKNKYIVVSAYSGFLYFISLSNKLVKKFKLQSEIYMNPLIYDDKVFCLDKKFFYILNLKGKVLGKLKLPSKDFSESTWIIAGDVDKDKKLELLLGGTYLTGSVYKVDLDIKWEKQRWLKEKI